MTKTLTENKWFYTENGIKDASWNIVLKSEVLAPVPSYDEWKKLDDELKELATMNDTFAIENGRLRERLVIAKKALVDILNDGDDYWDKDKAQEALTKMEGVK